MESHTMATPKRPRNSRLQEQNKHMQEFANVIRRLRFMRNRDPSV